MEQCGLLHPDCEKDLFGVHYDFLPRINSQLAQFVSAWNRNPLRTESGLSPLQLFHRGIPPQFQEDIASGLSVGDDYGVDICGGTSDDDDRVVVPEVGFILTSITCIHILILLEVTVMVRISLNTIHVFYMSSMTVHKMSTYTYS